MYRYLNYRMIYIFGCMIKNIYICWFQGFDSAPELVQKCVASWFFHNPSWTIYLIDDSNLSEYIDNSLIPNSRRLEMCHKSDLVRSILLATKGGLWVDATTFCMKPLDQWLPDVDFFAFYRHKRDRMICNWFLYANQGDYIMKRWAEETVRYYKENGYAKSYYIHHELFEKIYLSDPAFKEEWDSVPQWSSYGAHSFLKKMFDPVDSEIKESLNQQYVIKLSHHKDYSQFFDGCTLSYLYSTIDSIHPNNLNDSSSNNNMEMEGFIDFSGWTWQNTVEIILIIMICIVLAAATAIQAFSINPLSTSSSTSSSSLFGSSSSINLFGSKSNLFGSKSTVSNPFGSSSTTTNSTSSGNSSSFTFNPVNSIRDLFSKKSATPNPGSNPFDSMKQMFSSQKAGKRRK